MSHARRPIQATAGVDPRGDLSPLELAELSHRANIVCLERLRSGNVRSIVLATGVLYHLSAAAATAAECRQLLCNSGLIRQVQVRQPSLCSFPSHNHHVGCNIYARCR